MEDQKALEENKRCSGEPWKTGILWILALIVVGVVAFWLDPFVIRIVAEHSNKAAKQFASLLSEFGDWPELIAMGAVAWFLVRRNQRLASAVVCMMIAATLAGAAVNSVRLLSGRARPNNAEVAPGWYGVWRDGNWLIGKYKYHSFPSGHTGSAVAFFAVLGFAFRGWNWAFLLIGLAIGWSRVYLNSHYLSDVMIGAVVGLYFAQLTWNRIRPWLEERWRDLRGKQ
jgi:membrane-associated phospholipid phosphatase